MIGLILALSPIITNQPPIHPGKWSLDGYRHYRKLWFCVQANKYKQASKRLWMLRRLKKLGASKADLVDVYVKMIRCILTLKILATRKILTKIFLTKISIWENKLTQKFFDPKFFWPKIFILPEIFLPNLHFLAKKLRHRNFWVKTNLAILILKKKLLK